MQDSNPQEAIGLVGGFGGVVTVIGGIWVFIKFLFGRSDARQKALDEQQKELDKKHSDLVAQLEARIAEVEAEQARAKNEQGRLEAEQSRLKFMIDHWRVAFKMVADRLHQRDPKDEVLATACNMLRERVGQDDPFIPADMRSILNQLDEMHFPTDGTSSS